MNVDRELLKDGATRMVHATCPVCKRDYLAQIATWWTPPVMPGGIYPGVFCQPCGHVILNKLFWDSVQANAGGPTVQGGKAIPVSLSEEALRRLLGPWH
jgi:hypothetical protein